MDAAALLQVMRRRFLPMLLCVLAGVAGAIVLTARTTPVYEASAQVFVNIPAAPTVQTGFQGVQLTAELLPSYAEIATSRSVANLVRERLRLPESAESLRHRLSSEVLPQKLIIKVSARDKDPLRAESIADATTAALSDAVAELESGRATGTAVKVQVIDPAIGGTQISPRPTYNLVLGLLLGLLSGFVVAFVLEALDRSVKTAEQAEAATRAPVLAMLPKLKRDVRDVAVTGTNSAAEAYRSLRTAVRFADPDRLLQIVLVTSPSAGEGKTTTAVNLAVAFAQSGARTVLVDADLRRANVARMLGLEGSVGVTSVITQTASLEEALQTWHEGLMVLPAGVLPPNPSEMVGSLAMSNLLVDLDEYADTIIIDAPPVLPVTDAVVLSTTVQGVLLVTRAGKTQRTLAAEARRRLDGVGAAVIGCVVNGAKSSVSPGYYAYRARADAVSQSS